MKKLKPSDITKYNIKADSNNVLRYEVGSASALNEITALKKKKRNI